MNWYDYSRARLVINATEYLPPNAVNNSRLCEIEDVINENWDGSEYHCTAHMFSVAATALELAQRTHLLSPVEKLGVFFAGVFHDAGRRNINDRINVSVAFEIARSYLGEYPVKLTEDQRKALYQTVFEGIKATMYPSNKHPKSTVGKVLRDADFASLLTPAPIFQEASKALEDESGTPASYEFIKSQKAYLRVTQGYYWEHEVHIDLIG